MEEIWSLEEAFGRGLRRVREQQGLKQETLALMAGYVNHSNIAKIEGGKSLPSLGKALILARLLNMPIEALLVEGAETTAVHTQWMQALRLTMLGLSQETKISLANFLEGLAQELKLQVVT